MKFLIQSDDVMDNLNRIIVIGCSDNYINEQLIDIDQAYDFIDTWFTLPMLLLIFNLYLDYCGLKLSYGGTWNRLYRKISRKFRCFKYKK